jgi:hypothetical protein
MSAGRLPVIGFSKSSDFGNDLVAQAGLSVGVGVGRGIITTLFLRP